MNEKLEKLYNLYKQNGIIQSTDFNTFSSASEEQKRKLYDLGRQKGLFNSTDYNTFSSAFKPIKKKEPSASPSAQNQKPTSSVTQETKKPKPSVSSSVGGRFADVTEAVEKKKSTAQKDTKPQIVFPGQEGKRNDIFTGYPGKEGKKYRLDNSTGTPVWMEYTSSAVKGANSSQNYDIYNTPVTDPARVAELNRHFKQKASSSEIDQVFTGFPGKESNEYRVRDGKWERKEKGSKSWQTVINEGSILGLNKQFNQNVEPVKDINKAKIEQKREIENKKNMNALLASINSDLVGSSEEYASEELEKKFPGFKFIQQGPFTDQLLVIAPNDNIVKISLDNFTDGDDRTQATRLREFIRNNSDQDLTLASERLSAAEEKERRFNEDELKRRGIIPPEFKFVDGKLQVDFTEEINKNDINQTARSIVKNNIESEIKNARKEYIDKKEQQFNDIYHRFKGSNASSQEITSAYASVKKDNYEIKRVNQYINDVKNTSVDIAREKSTIESEMNDIMGKVRSGEISQEDYNATYRPEIEAKLADLKNKSNSLVGEMNNIQNVNRAVDESIAKNFLIDEATGSFGGGIASKFLKGLTYLPRLASLGEMTKKDQEAIVSSITGGGTTKEYMESEDRSDLTKAMFSLAESMGALTAGAGLGGGAATYASFYAQSYYEMKDELDQIEGMSNESKVLMSSVYGGLSSVLEKFGIDMITQKSSIGRNLKNNILKRMFSELPKNASKEYIDAAMLNSAKMTLRDAGLNIVGGSLGEGVTESLQSLTQVGVKEVYDWANNTDYFNNKSGWEIVGDVLYEGYLGALGGGIMSTVTSSPKVLKNGILNTLNGDQAEMLIKAAKTEGIDQALMTNLKASVLTGKISKDEAVEISNSFSDVKSKIDQIPDGLSISDKSVALDLMVEKSKIEKEIAGKDENLTSVQRERISKINTELKTISQNAVQEQTTGEVSVQPETTTGQEVEGGKPEAEPKVITEEGKEEVISPESYVDELERTKASDPGAYWSVSSVDVDTAKESTIVGDSEGKGIVTKDGDIKGVFKSIGVITKGVADKILKKAVAVGGIKLDNYDNYLTKTYERNGFRVVSRTPFNEEFAPEGWNESLHGRPDVVAMIYDPEGKLDIEEKTFDDYDQAMAYRDSLVEQARDQYKTSEPSSMDTTLSKIKEAAVSGDKRKGSMYKAIRSSMQAMPGVKIFVHDSKEAYQEAIARSTGQNKDQVVEDETNDRTAGTILENGEIHIDASIADAATVYHEMFHYAAMQMGLSAADIRSLVDAVKSSTKNKELIARAEKFAKQYEDKSIEDDESLTDEERDIKIKENKIEVDDEFFTELGALLTASEELLQPKNIQKFFTIINNMFKKLGLPAPFTSASTRQDAIDFINSLSKGMREGTDVSSIVKNVDNNIPIENEYVETNGSVVQTGSKRKARIVNTTIKDSDIIDPAILEGKPLEIVYYDNYTASDYTLTNRVSGTSIKRKGGGGPGYSYREEIRNAGIIAAFTNVTKGLNLIQGISSRNKVSGDEAVVGVALQNKETGHLGNKDTLFDIYNPNDGEIARAVNDEIISASDAVKMLKDAVVAYEQTKKGQDPKSSLGFSSNDFSTLDEFFNLLDGISFERRGSFNAIVIPSKSDLKITKATKPHVVAWLEAGIPTLSDYYSASTEAYTAEAEAHDIVKYINPNLRKIGVPKGFDVSEKEMSRAKEMGVEIEFIDDSLIHRSYPVVLFGDNIGVPSTFHSVRDMSEEWNEPNPFFKAGRRKDTASPVRIPKLNETGRSPKADGRKKRLAPKVAEKLTEDGNGNYVFQHWSSQKRDSIKPGTGQNSITGKDEASSLSAVGGLAQYYTMKDQSESGTGNVLHTVLVPMDKVYDAYNDPMGFAEEARRQFNEVRPGQGFDEGYRAAFITKVANDNGYDMTVYPWRNTELRAQTTLELKPEKENIDFKDRTKEEYNVGDKINVYGEDAVVTSVEGPIVSFKSETSEGSINVDRSPRSIRKKRKAPKKDDTQKKIDKELKRPVSKKTVNEYAALKDQLRNAAKAARQAAKSIKDVQKAIASEVKSMVKSGKVSAKQAAILTDRLARLNTENPLMVERYLAYAEKVFENADYAQRLTDALSIRKKIKRLSKSPNNQAEVRAMGKAFLEIDPSMVDDIDVYNEMAQMIFDALKPSRVSGTDAIYKSAALIEDVNIYTNEMVSMQEDKKKDEMLNLYSELVSAGVLSEDMSLKDIQTIVQSIENDEDVSKKDEKAVRDYNKNTFGMLSSIVRDAMGTGIDPITGESVDWDEKATDLIKRLMNIDMDRLSVREGFMAIEALQNFMVNGITSGVEATVYAYDGALNAEKVANEGIKARDLRVYLSKMAGRIMSANFATIPVLFDSMFGGVRNGGRVMEAMGLSRYSNGVAKATKIMNNIVNEYGKVFSKQKPNGESFNSSKNVYERGMLAFLKRTVMGSDAEMNEELARRISLLRDSIKELRKGGDSDMKKADIYEELFSKLGLDREGISIIDIESRVDKINRDAVDWWIGKWSEHYPDLYDVSLSVFNTQLGKDLNYTPDRFSRTETSEVMSKTEQEEMLAKAGAFSINMDFTDKNKSGVLMEATRPKKTPGRYVDLDFDMSNSNAMKAALIDINTAGVVRQIDSFLRSDAFKSMIPNKKDYTLLRGRVNSYIRRTKGKDAISNDSLRELNKVTNVLAGLGSTKALGGIFQPIKQTLPVIMNTLINAGRFNPMSVMDKGYNEWLDNSGMSIANRGLESSASIDTANKYLDKAADGGVETVLKYANKLNEMWLKVFLSKPDVVVARASFQAYYKQDLKRQGVSTDIDWTNHEINQEAANYAQHMVDRQQNVSDAAMGGEFMASNDTTKKLVRKVAMPFANFVMNQKNRMYSDIRTLQNRMSTKEDKRTAGRSLIGLTVEMISYQVIAYALTEAVIKPIAAEIAGYIPSDDEEEKQEKYAMQRVVSQGAKDFLSPMPFFDGVTLMAFNYVADQVQDVENWAEGDSQGLKDAIAMKNESLDDPMTGKDLERFKEKWLEEKKWKFEDFPEQSTFNLGTLTIVLDKLKSLKELATVAKTGEFIKEYNGIETKQYLMEEDRSILKPMVAVEALHILGALPVEASSITRNVEKFVKKKGITEAQKDKYDLVKKKYGKVEPWMMEIVKSKKREDGTIQEIEWVKSFGDLNEKQGSKYVEIFKKREGQVTYDDMMRISKMK